MQWVKISCSDEDYFFYSSNFQRIQCILQLEYLPQKDCYNNYHHN